MVHKKSRYILTIRTTIITKKKDLLKRNVITFKNIPIRLLFADKVLSIGNCPIASGIDLMELSDTSNVRNVLGRLLISGGS